MTDAIQEWVGSVAQIPVARDNTKRPDVCVIEVRTVVKSTLLLKAYLVIVKNPSILTP